MKKIDKLNIDDVLKDINNVMNIVKQVENIDLEKDDLDKLKKNVIKVEKNITEKYGDIVKEESKNNFKSSILPFSKLILCSGNFLFT